MIMEAISNLHIPRRMEKATQGITVLAGDVGGTKTNLAFYQATEKGLQLLHEKRYPSDEYPSFTLVLQQFLADHGQLVPDRICIGVAGPVLGGKVELTNLSWVIEVADIQEQLKVQQVSLINDLEAVAYGLATLGTDDFITLRTGDVTMQGNMAIVAPGTGLGEAGICWTGKAHYPFPTEGGHTGFAPRTTLDLELFRYLQKKYDVVSWERVIAGPAIEDIYTFLRDVMNRSVPEWLTTALLQAEDPSAIISRAGIENKAAICAETMDHFVRYLAYESANLVLKMKATGGLFLGGGIPPKIAPLLQQESFFRHYMDCDRMQHLLENIPIRIINNDKAALMGAGYYGAYGEW